MIYRRKVFVVVGVDRYPKEPVIFLLRAVLNLLGGEHADQTHVDQAADMCWGTRADYRKILKVFAGLVVTRKIPE